MRHDKTKSAIIVGNIPEVVRNRKIRSETPFVITPTDSYYFFEGERREPKEFEKEFHNDFKPLNTKGKNSDRTKNWMHGEKSY